MNLRNENGQTFANADGSLTSQVSPVEVWLKRADGSWTAVSTDLTQGTDGRWSPTTTSGLSLSNGGDAHLLRMVKDGDTIAVDWPTALPAPSVKGDTATYAAVLPNTDLQVEATRRGYLLRLVLSAAPTAPLSLALPLSVTSVAAGRRDDGGVDFKNAKGELKALMAPSHMWDADTDPATGLAKHDTPVATSLTSTAGGQVLTLTPDFTWLTDPTRHFPVSIDPSTNWVARSGTTFVRSDQPASSAGYNSNPLYVGTPNGSAVYHSFLGFNSNVTTTSPWYGKYVSNAYVQLYNNYSSTCWAAGAPVYAWPQNAAYTYQTTWNSQPQGDWSRGTVAYFAHGQNSTCPGAYDNIDLTNLAQRWASGDYTIPQVELTASDTSVYGWKQFQNGNAGWGVPQVSVTWEPYPDTPGFPSVTNPSPTVVGTTPWVRSLHPTLQAPVTLPGGGWVQGYWKIFNGSTQVWGSYSTTVQSGNVTAVTVQNSDGSSPLQEGVLYTAQVWGQGAHAQSKSSSSTIQFEVDATAPAAPTVSSATYPSGQWTSTASPSSSFTLSATDPGAGASGVDHYLFALDGPTPNLATSSGSSVATFPSPIGDGWHTLTFAAVDAAGNVSPVSSYSFGIGASVTSPSDGQVTQKSLALGARTSSGQSSAVYYYRRAATESWAPIPSGDVGLGAWPLTWTAGTGDSIPPALTWNAANTLGNTDGPAQVAVCFGSSCPTSATATLPPGSSTVPVNVKLDQKAFNASATTNVSGIGLNLLTGNTQISATDVSLPGNARTTLSVSRTLNTATAATTTGGVFGPGWTAGLPVDSAAVNWSSLVDTGTVYSVKAPDQTSIDFTGTPGGTYTPVADARDSGYSISSGASADCPTGTPRCLILTDGDGVNVVFTAATTAIGTLAAPVTFALLKVTEPGNSSATSFSYTVINQVSVVNRVTAPTPTTAGASCSDPTGTGTATWTPGCRALDLTYDTNAHLTSVTYDTSDGTNPLRVDVACYSYDTNGRLADAWDPRNITTPNGTGTHPIVCGTTPLRSTHYSYDASSGRVTTITPAWNGTSTPIAGIKLTYDGTGRLSSVTRTHLNNSGTETTLIGYGVPLSPDSTNPSYRPDLASGTAGTWAQADVPDSNAGGTVICPPSAGMTTLSTTGDLTRCAISYLDLNGRAVNTATYAGTAAAGWHISTTEYDSVGRTVRTLTPANREEALTPTTGAGAALGLPADTRAASLALSTVSQYAINSNSADKGADLTDTYGPYHQVALAAGGYANARAHTHLAYDTGSETGHPAGGSLHLVTDSITGASRSMAAVVTSETDDRETQSAYALAGDNTGWTFRRPMQTVTDPGAGHLAITRQTTYDPTTGLVIQTRMPNDTANVSPGTTAGTTVNTYYSVSSTDATCGTGNTSVSIGLVDGLLCRTSPANLTPTAGAPGLITKTYNYDPFQRVTSVVETPAGDAGHARTTTTSYGFNSTSNPWATTVAASAVSGGIGTALSAQTFSYDTASDLLTGLTGGGITDSRGYDDFGRQTSYTENTAVSAPTATTTYDPTTGLVTATSDAHRSTSLTYNGGNERRGLVTAMSVSVNSTPAWTGNYTASYDANGAPVGASDANGITQALTRDENGQLIKRVDSNGSNPWLSDAAYPNVFGQWLRHDGASGSQNYSYDAVGRLTLAQDRPVGTGCSTRSYGFDADSNRTSSASYSPAADGTCQTASAANSATHSYDAADRITDSGVTYDSFGRTSTLPAVLSPSGSTLSLTYYVNDLVASAPGTSWTLDQTQQRLASWTVGTVTKTNHYDDAGSDSPAWIDEGNSTWTANIGDLLGSLAATVTNAGAVTHQYANLHGDVAAICAAGAGATTLAPDFDEFGNLPSGASNLGRYGWLGGKRRSSADGAGLVLMGVRLYAPTLGRFLSTDPIVGGNLTSYDYVGQDPVNSYDLDGRCWTCWVSTGLTVVSIGAGILAFTPCSAVCAGISAGASVLNAGIEFSQKKYVDGALDLASAASFGVGKALEKAGARAGRQLMKVRKYKLKLHRAQRRLGRLVRAQVGQASGDEAMLAWSGLKFVADQSEEPERVGRGRGGEKAA